ncbi:hypothetical protein EV361DRAFT_312612 [Lentinula raphanica]|uniref:Uncharacterized protein n=1 Tax=Lentinula raphanica TaxID=153919 RepID=A0AA38P7E5_9AGAR|nr:hypothetical protein F5878DRAFT_621648 [Lentinula raphanica]KAJ3970025.1 hypothetical protein EV361DRAFT_312612 [Lentinula raphanica]
MPIHLGIALYYVPGQYGAPSYFHWVLVATSASSWASQPLLSFELKRQSPSDPYTRFITSTNILRDNAFKGVVHLFTTTNYDLNTLQALITDNFSASDSGWRLPGPYGPQGWTCATWILCFLSRMREEGTWVTDRNFEHVYTRVLNLGHELLERTRNVHSQGGVHVISF